MQMNRQSCQICAHFAGDKRWLKSLQRPMGQLSERCLYMALGKNNHVWAKKTVLSHIPGINAYNQNEGQCIKTEMIQSHYNLTSTVLH